MTRIYQFLLLATLLLAGCDYFPGTVGEKAGVSTCYIEEHPSFMRNSLGIQCSYGAKCSAEMGFGIYSFDTTGCLYCKAGCLNYDYRYRLVQGTREKIIQMSSSVDLDIDPDEHVRFSIFDKANVEKTYDIDLSKIIYSYEMMGDSVVVTPPYSNTDIYTICRTCSENQNFCSSLKYFFADGSEINMEVFESNVCSNYYRMISYLSGQSSLGTDSLSIHATIYVQ